MTAATRLRSTLFAKGHITTVTVVAAAFVVTYFDYFADLRSGDAPPFSASHLIIATLLGAIFLALAIAALAAGLAIPDSLRPHPVRTDAPHAARRSD